MFQSLDDEHIPPEGDFTHVMVRLKAPELEAVDTLSREHVPTQRRR
jgi:hypothetical protein